jgi:hypothetical protein
VVDKATDQETLQFILENVQTVPHLEATLLIWQNQTMAWTADLLARRIYVSAAVGKDILDDLTRQGLLRKCDQDATYMYDAGWDADRDMLARVADLYRRQLVQVTKLIHSKGSSSVREFARAFQFKKEQ